MTSKILLTFCPGNEFSSVDGLVFRWTFEGHSTDAESSNEPVLRWVKFADSSYDVIPSIAALESQGQQGHVVLIEGLRTGSARVSVQLDNESFKVKSRKIFHFKIQLFSNAIFFPTESTCGDCEYCRRRKFGPRPSRTLSYAWNGDRIKTQSDSSRTS